MESERDRFDERLKLSQPSRVTLDGTRAEAKKTAEKNNAKDVSRARPFIEISDAAAAVVAFDFQSCALQEHCDRREELSKKKQHILRKMDIASVRALSQMGLLDMFLQVGDHSLKWMFNRADETQSGSSIPQWARFAIDGDGTYYQAVYRFWTMFIQHDVQDHIVDDVVLELPLVSLAFADYRGALTVCDDYVRRHYEALPFETVPLEDIDRFCLRAQLETFSAAAHSCMHGSQVRDAKFRTLFNHLSLAQQSLEDRFDPISVERKRKLNTRVRVAIREWIRSIVRDQWVKLGLSVSTWPEVNQDSSATKAILKLRDRLSKCIELDSMDCSPVDYDTLARVSLFYAPKDERIKQWIDKARDIWTLRQNSAIDGSSFSEDSIDITEALFLLSCKKDPQELLDKCQRRASMNKRQHTGKYVRALISLRSKSWG